MIREKIKNAKLEDKRDPNKMYNYSGTEYRTAFSYETSASLKSFVLSEKCIINHYQYTKKYKKTPDLYLCSSVSNEYSITGYAFTGSFMSTESKFDYVACVSGSNIGYHYSGLWTNEQINAKLSSGNLKYIGTLL